MISGITVVTDEQNVPLPASVVSPADPANQEEGAIGVGEAHAPLLNTEGLTDGIEVPQDPPTDGAPVLAGDEDRNDNDPAYIDEILWPDPDTFQPTAEMVSESLFGDEKLKNQKPQTKVLQASVPAGAFSTGISFDPVMLFPADSDRVELVIKAISTVATTWRFGSDKQSCYTAAQIPTTDPALVLRNHTGPVWVYSADTTNAFVVNGWTVTK